VLSSYGPAVAHDLWLGAKDFTVACPEPLDAVGVNRAPVSGAPYTKVASGHRQPGEAVINQGPAPTTTHLQA